MVAQIFAWPRKGVFCGLRLYACFFRALRPAEFAEESGLVISRRAGVVALPPSRSAGVSISFVSISAFFVLFIGLSRIDAARAAAGCAPVVPRGPPAKGGSANLVLVHRPFLDLQLPSRRTHPLLLAWRCSASRRCPLSLRPCPRLAAQAFGRKRPQTGSSQG